MKKLSVLFLLFSFPSCLLAMENDPLSREDTVIAIEEVHELDANPVAIPDHDILMQRFNAQENELSQLKEIVTNFVKDQNSCGHRCYMIISTIGSLSSTAALILFLITLGVDLSFHDHSS